MVDLILLHPPVIYEFKERKILLGPIADVIPSTPIFEMYPLGFISIVEYLERHGYKVKIINIATRMLKDRKFSLEKLIKSLKPKAFGIDFHWLPHINGVLRLAELLKSLQPNIPVIIGGLSASYYYKELISYPYIDYIIRGDSTEEPFLQLMNSITSNGEMDNIPNLVWKNKSGTIKINEFSYIPSNLDYMFQDYERIINSVFRDRDLVSYLPFKDWLKYPITAVLLCRGCNQRCITCGGSSFAYRLVCHREYPAWQSPEQVAKTIHIIQQYIRGPIFILFDIRAAGNCYTEELLERIKKLNIKNQVIFELFSPAGKDFFKQLKDSVKNFNIQISPESHDESIRRASGKPPYTNQELEDTLKYALEYGAQRVDVFFMIGLPEQTVDSVRETLHYCRVLLRKFGTTKRLHPFISPLAPFLDPGSIAFEQPERYGYKLFYKTLEEHREALLKPSWKYTLNYETKWLSRTQIVELTYEVALGLNKLKREFGLIKEKIAHKIERRIKEAQKMMAKIEEGQFDSIKNFPELSKPVLCQEEELRWPTPWPQLNITKILWNIFNSRKKVSRDNPSTSKAKGKIDSLILL